MKKILSYIIVIVITYIIAAFIHNPELRNKLNTFFKKTPQEVIIKNMYIKPKIVYVRKEPLDKAEILGTLKRNTEVGLITIQDKWAKVKTPAGISGWVLLDSLKEQPPQTTTKKEEPKQEIQQEDITYPQYQDLSEKSKIPSSVISAFDTQPEPSPDEPPEIIKQEIQKKQTQKPTTTKTITTQPKTEEVKKEITTQPLTEKPTQQEITTTTIPKKPKKETTTQTTTTEETINCPNCGAEVIKGERFCPICREQLIR